MRRSFTLAVLAAALASCVGVETPPDPRGAIKPGQRLIVMVFQSPGPWIVADSDSKAETALKLLPLGNFLQGMQEERINEVSKELQPYLPRPRYDQAVEAEMIRLLKLAHGGPVQTAAEAGIDPRQRKDWNAASDPLDWRRKFWFTDAGRGSPRDYTKLLSLDDAVIIEINISFGLEPNEEERTVPVLSATSRAYRADTARMMWSREERLGDKTSSSTLSEFRAVPSDLTDRLYAMSLPFALQIAGGLARETGLIPPAPPILAPAATFVNGAPADISTAPVAAISPSTTAAQAPVTPAWPPITQPAPTAPPSASTGPSWQEQVKPRNGLQTH